MAIKEVWSDIHHNLVMDGQGSIKKVSNIDSVITSIDNILRTRPGERCYLPEFASTLQGMLFEPINDMLKEKLAREVKRVIERWDNRVTVTQVDYFAEPDNNFVTMNVNFRIRGYPQQVFTYSTQLLSGGA